VLEKAPTWSEQVLLFARNFLKHPKMLGSLIPSSRFLIQEVLSRINWEQARVLVEYGPGVGTITVELLRRMHPEARLLVIETNDEFVHFLRTSVRDPRLHVVHGSAAEVSHALERLGYPSADYIISGIPFSTMPREIREDILRATRAALSPEGAFCVYQFSGAVQPHLERSFRKVHRRFEPLNILPARLFYCSR
jgi:phospholipid N-methyltransferase